MGFPKFTSWESVLFCKGIWLIAWKMIFLTLWCRRFEWGCWFYPLVKLNYVKSHCLLGRLNYKCSKVLCNSHYQRVYPIQNPMKSHHSSTMFHGFFHHFLWVLGGFSRRKSQALWATLPWPVTRAPSRQLGQKQMWRAKSGLVWSMFYPLVI